MNTLALYYRASNEDANLGESATIQNQRDLLRHYIKGRPEFADWSVLEFQDDGWSGTTFDRPGVQKMLQMAGAGIQCVVVKDFSRFGRNLIEVGDYLDQVFPFLGVRFIAVNENFDSKDSKGRTVGLDVTLKAMVYELYSRDLSKKIGSVKEAQMKKGQYIGRIAFYGYQKSTTEKHKLVVDEEAAGVVRRIFSLAADGMKPVKIAVLLNGEKIQPAFTYRNKNHPEALAYCPQVRKYNLWTRESVGKIIRDERYTGCFIGRKELRIDISTKKMKPLPKEDWIRVENAFEAIVGAELYEKAQAVLRKPRNNAAMLHPTDLFRGLLVCEACGRALTKFASSTPHYYCMTGKNAPDMPCAEVKVDKAELGRIVLSSLHSMLQLIAQTEVSSCENGSVEGHIHKRLDQLKTETDKCKAEQVILFERFADGKMNRQSYLAEKQVSANRSVELTADVEKLTIQLQDLDLKAVPPAGKDLGKYAFAETLTREMLVEVIKEIRVSGTDTIQIVWNFKNEYTTDRP